MDTKDLDDTVARTRQTVAQVECFLREGREHLGRQAELLGHHAIAGNVISTFVEAQSESFRDAYACERQAGLNVVMTPTCPRLPVPGPRAKLLWQRV
ncbi:hypothetical protein GGE46_006107 [Rhizobium etli]|uniref:Uncharacterized protein n=1 Tax=Rhizobium etli TaxID=29449 RepID=A0A7W7EHK6_RHIET|nr:hypothetical protein [Rhizobium etli]MBB4539297.1 hypothetical protein [Rhizobium etli]